MRLKRKKVVITGGTGLLASNIALYKREDWEILLLTRNHTLTFEGVSTTKANLLDLDSTTRIFESFDPDLVIHTAGLTNVDECEKNFYEAHLANTVIAKNMAKLCSTLKKKFVHISTDHFSNENLEYSTEMDIGVPLNTYAGTKLLGEVEVRQHCPDSLAIRTNFFGWGHNSRLSFSDFIIENLRKNKPITLFEDVYYTPIFIDDLTDSIEHLVAKKLSGIYNVVTNKRISKYEFGLKIANIFNLNSDLINKSSISSKQMTRRPLNMALSNKKLLESLGNDFDFDILTSIKKLKDVEFQGRKKKLLDSFEDRQANKKEQIHYGKQFIDESDINFVISTLLSSHLTQGPKVQEFEERVANYTGSKYAVSFTNLTCGLHAAYLSIGIRPGDYIITSPLTFVATSNAAIYCGAIPLFADIDPTTLNIDPNKAEELLMQYKGKIKAIVPVHFAGSPCNMTALNALANKYQVILIEDAAHALGGKYQNGDKIGSSKNSHLTGFSFHPVKNVTTGEGAIMTTNDAEIYKQLCRVRSHGITKGNDQFIRKELAMTNGHQNSWYYEMQSLGYNFRLTDFQSALGISQMSKLDTMMTRRRELAAIYDRELSQIPYVEILQKETRNISGNHLYTIKIDFKEIGLTRNEVFQIFSNQGIHLHVHYIPVFLQPFYKNIEGNEMAYNCKHALDYYDQAVTLPLHPLLSEKNIETIVELLIKLKKS